MKMQLLSCCRALLVMVLLLGASSAGATRLLKAGLPEDIRRDTQANAYSSAAGQNPGGPGDAFTWFDAEASATSNYNGIYFKDGTKTIEAGDRSSGGWSGAYTKNNADRGTTVAVATNIDTEYAFQRGVHAIATTYEGARATAGSHSMYGAAPGSTATWIIDSYGPTSMPNVNVGPDDIGPDRKRSTAFTNIAPNSAAQSGWGNGPAAVASGWEVSSAARAQRDKPVPVTVGSRDPGDKYQALFETASLPKAATVSSKKNSGRRHLLLRGL